MTEYKYQNATVRIHEGKLTAEERRTILEEAAREFYKAILRSGAKKDQGKGPGRQEVANV